MTQERCVVTHYGTHAEAFVHEPISEVVTLKHQEVPVMVDLTSYSPVRSNKSKEYMYSASWAESNQLRGVRHHCNVRFCS